MSWLEFIVQMSQALAWPIVGGGTILLLRKQIKGAATALVSRVDDIRSLKAPGVNVEFHERARAIAATTAATTEELKNERPKALPAAQRKDVVLPPETAGERFDKYERLAQLDPRAAILLSFSDMEGAIRHRFRDLYPTERPTLGMPQIVNQLLRDEYVDPDIAGALKQMSSMRNQVAHERTELDLDVADYFIQSTGNVLDYLMLSGFFGDGAAQKDESGS